MALYGGISRACRSTVRLVIKQQEGPRLEGARVLQSEVAGGPRALKALLDCVGGGGGGAGGGSYGGGSGGVSVKALGPPSMFAFEVSWWSRGQCLEWEGLVD